MGLISSLMGNAGVVENKKLDQQYGGLLTEGERIEIGFKLIRDLFVFTNKRMIIVDVQGLTGKKVEYKSISYDKIVQFSIESAGHFDLDAELKIWVTGQPMPISKKFNRKVNIYDVQRVLATFVLG